jgi:hypothetical protein
MVSVCAGVDPVLLLLLLLLLLLPPGVHQLPL